MRLPTSKMFPPAAKEKAVFLQAFIWFCKTKKWHRSLGFLSLPGDKRASFGPTFPRELRTPAGGEPLPEGRVDRQKKTNGGVVALSPNLDPGEINEVDHL